MPTQRQRRKRRRRLASGEGRSSESAPPLASASARQRGSESPPAKRGPDDRPSPPWGTFPLTEIVILIGLVLLVVGFFITPPQGFVMIGVGLGLGSLAGLELAIREHFA